MSHRPKRRPHKDPQRDTYTDQRTSPGESPETRIQRKPRKRKGGKPTDTAATSTSAETAQRAPATATPARPHGASDVGKVGLPVMSSSRPDAALEPLTSSQRGVTPAQEIIFSWRAWLKYQFICHLGATEVGAFGITRALSPLYIDDIVMVRQQCTEVSVEFDDLAVADYFEEQVDAGRRPEQFARIWLHTHPGDSAAPSGTDEETFDRVFGDCDWAAMVILARCGAVYARLRVSGGAPADHRLCLSKRLTVSVDYQALPDSDPRLPLDEWRAEYESCVDVIDRRLGPLFRGELEPDGSYGMDFSHGLDWIEDEHAIGAATWDSQDVPGLLLEGIGADHAESSEHWSGCSSERSLGPSWCGSLRDSWGSGEEVPHDED
jgi:hypothetical protein